MASPKLNRTYLMDRVTSEMHKTIHKLENDQATEVERVYTDLIKSVTTDEPHLNRLRQRMTKLNKQLDALTEELKVLRVEIETDYPYLTLTSNGEVELKRSWDRHPARETPVDAQVKKIHKAYSERVGEVRQLCTAFTDKIMMGEATYEEFSSLMEALSK